MKFELNASSKQVTIGLIHLGIFIVSLSIATAYSIIYWKIAFPIMMAEFGVVIILVFSMLDYLDIIQFRKTVTRQTKCCVCDRVSERQYEKEILVKVEKFKSKKLGDSEKEVTKQEVVPRNPLEGIIISGKVICTDCIEKVKKFG